MVAQSTTMHKPLIALADKSPEIPSHSCMADQQRQMVRAALATYHRFPKAVIGPLRVERLLATVLATACPKHCVLSSHTHGWLSCCAAAVHRVHCVGYTEPAGP